MKYMRYILETATRKEIGNEYPNHESRITKYKGRNRLSSQKIQNEGNKESYRERDGEGHIQKRSTINVK